MNQIKCKACGPGDSGCYTCGGYKFVYEQWECPVCSKTAWVRPGNYTVYDGKRFTTMDGVRIVYSLLPGEIYVGMKCEECYETVLS